MFISLCAHEQSLSIRGSEILWKWLWLESRVIDCDLSRFILLKTWLEPSWVTIFSTWSESSLSHQKSWLESSYWFESRYHCYYVALSLYRDKRITIIRFWWLSQWLVPYGRHLLVTIIGMERMTGAFTRPFLYDICYKCQPNLSIREQPLLPGLDVFGMGLVVNRPSRGVEAEILPKIHDPINSSWTPRGSQPTRSLSLSS